MSERPISRVPTLQGSSAVKDCLSMARHVKANGPLSPPILSDGKAPDVGR